MSGKETVPPTKEIRAVSEAEIEAAARQRMADDGNPHELEHLPPKGAKPAPGAPQGAPIGEILARLSPEQRDAAEAVIAAVAERMVAKKLAVDEAKALLLEELHGIVAPAAAPASGEDQDEMDELVTVDVLEGDDYVQKTIPVRQFLQMTREPEDMLMDPFALSEAYRRGDHARFDYYWGDTVRPSNYRTARAMGWVPVKESLDGMHEDTDGFVRMGDSMLMRRPKVLSERYRQQQRERAAAMVGEQGPDVREGELTATSYLNEYRAETNAEAGFREAPAPAQRGREADLRAEAADRAKLTAKGRKSFSFERNPLHENKVRAAVAALRSG